MPDPVSFKSYRRESAAIPAGTFVVGLYDGLATEPVAHAHDQLLVPLAGRIHLDWPGGAAIAAPHAAVYLPAGLAHAASTLDASFRFLALDVDPGWGGGGANPVFAHDVGFWLVAEGLARVVSRQGPLAPDGPGGPGYLAAGLAQLSGLFAATRGGGPRLADDLVMAAVAIILARYPEPLTVAGIAAEIAVSPRHLERRFHADLATTPRAFLIGRRMAAARDLLASTDLAVEQIATAVGCPDVAHFQRTFKSAVGLPPGAYRRGRRVTV